MLYLLGIGSNVAMMSCLMTVIRDRFKKVKNWHAALVIAILGTCFGSIYMTPVSLLFVFSLTIFDLNFLTFLARREDNRCSNLSTIMELPSLLSC
jgi:solute carrier family 6 (neurotransmitter transporter, glycine) member 5/9